MLVGSCQFSEREVHWQNTERSWRCRRYIHLPEWHPIRKRNQNSFPRPISPHTQNPRHRFEFCQKIVDTFWKRRFRNALPLLLQRKKSTDVQRRNVRVNDFVIVADPNPIHVNWNVWRIIQVFPGEDGVVRNFQVKTGAGTYTVTCPITKICVIHPAEGITEYSRISPLLGDISLTDHRHGLNISSYTRLRTCLNFSIVSIRFPVFWQEWALDPRTRTKASTSFVSKRSGTFFVLVFVLT